MAQSRRDSCWRSLSPSSNNRGHEVKYLQTVESMTQASVHLSWPKDLRQRRRRMLSKCNSLEKQCSLQGKCRTHSGRVGPEDPSHPFPQLDRDLRGAQPWMNTKHCGRPVGPLLPGTPGSPFGPCSPCEKSRTT